jgi:hypothetical protein
MGREGHGQHGDRAPWAQEACGNDGRRGRLPYNPNGGWTARPELGIGVKRAVPTVALTPEAMGRAKGVNYETNPIRLIGLSDRDLECEVSTLSIQIRTLGAPKFGEFL